MTLFMRLLHYPGRGALNIMEPKPLVSCYLWQLPRCRIMTNELWAARRLRTNNLLSCCPPVYFPWQTSNDPSVTFCCPKITANSLWCVSDYLSPRLMPSPSTRCICQLWCPPPKRCVPWSLWFVSPQVILCHLCVRPPLLPPGPLTHC